MRKRTVSVTPVVAATTYGSGDNVGGKLSFGQTAFGPTGMCRIESLHLIDKGDEDAPMDLLIFDRDPEAATLDDNDALVLSTDVAYVVARIPIAAADYETIDGTAFVTLGNLGVLVKSNGSDRSLYGALLTTGTPDYVAGDLTLTLGVTSF